MIPQSIADIVYGPDYQFGIDVGLGLENIKSLNLILFRDLCKLNSVLWEDNIIQALAPEGSQIQVIKLGGTGHQQRVFLDGPNTLTRTLDLKKLNVAEFPYCEHMLPIWFYVQWKTWYVNAFNFGEYGFFIKKELTITITG